MNGRALSLSYSWDYELSGLGCVAAKEAEDDFLFLHS